MRAFFQSLVRGFRDEHFGVLSASLAFTTLLSIVPMVSVTLAVASTLPIFDQWVGHVDRFLIDHLLPAKTGGVITKYTLQFSKKATKLTVVGLGVLLLTSLMLFTSIEKALNHVWRVKTPRPFFQRLGRYSLIILLGPLVLGAVLTASTFAITASFGWISDSGALRQTALKGLSFLMISGFFAFIYYALPNAKVRIRHALLGGVLAASGLLIIQRILEWYVAGFASYTLIYGAFSAIPIFLLWLYLSWAVVLACALVTASLKVSTPAKVDGHMPNRRVVR